MRSRWVLIMAILGSVPAIPSATACDCETCVPATESQPERLQSLNEALVVVRMGLALVEGHLSGNDRPAALTSAKETLGNWAYFASQFVFWAPKIDLDRTGWSHKVEEFHKALDAVATTLDGNKPPPADFLAQPKQLLAELATINGIAEPTWKFQEAVLLLGVLEQEDRPERATVLKTNLGDSMERLVKTLPETPEGRAARESISALISASVKDGQRVVLTKVMETVPLSADESRIEFPDYILGFYK